MGANDSVLEEVIVTTLGIEHSLQDAPTVRSSRRLTTTSVALSIHTPAKAPQCATFLTRLISSHYALVNTRARFTIHIAGINRTNQGRLNASTPFQPKVASRTPAPNDPTACQPKIIKSFAA